MDDLNQGWPRLGDGVACLILGNDAACRRFAFWHYVFPHIQRVLEELDLIGEAAPPLPRPDPPPSDVIHEILPLLLAPAFGDPNPVPSLVEARLDALKKTVGALDSLKSTLEGEIDRISDAAK